MRRPRKLDELLKNKPTLQTVYKAASIILALAVWQVVSMIVGMDMLLASPFAVIKRLATIWLEAGFWQTVLFSVLRITAGYLLAVAAGIILALLAHRFRPVETLLWPYMVTIKSVPVASFIILCLIWFSFTQLTVFIAFLISFPVIYTNVLNSLKNTDPRMTEMAHLYRMNWPRELLYVYLPAVKPGLISACSIAAGMAWKSGVAAEVIGLVNGSIGERLYEAKIYFQNADLLSWTIIIVLLSVLLEKVFIGLLKLAFRGLERI